MKKDIGESNTISVKIARILVQQFSTSVAISHPLNSNPPTEKGSLYDMILGAAIDFARACVYFP